jgi:hypothetical protein
LNNYLKGTKMPDTDKHHLKGFTKSNKKENKKIAKETAYKSNGEIESTEVKDAHASGIGALERSDKDQIEKTDYREIENDDAVY